MVTWGMGEAMVLPKKKKVMLPLLIMLFLISYGLLSMLVVEQGRTIESQRGLIRDLFNDSTELSALKGKEILKGRIAKPSSEGKPGAPHKPQEAAPQKGLKAKSAVRSQRPTLQKPPKPAMDAADARRIPLTV